MENASQTGDIRKYPSTAVVNGDTQKREIFFVCGQTKDMRSADDGKRRDPYASGSRYFMRELQQKKARGVCQTQAPRAFSINHHILLLDFSPSLGMDESMVTQAKATSQVYHALGNPRSPVNSPARHRSL